MFSGDQVVVIVDEGEVCAARMTPSAAGSGIARRPLLVSTDGVGDPVGVGTPGAAHQAVDGLLSRVGDPVPVRVGTRTWPAEILVALIIADAAAAVADESAGPLVLVLPDEWRAHRRELLRGAVAQLTEQPVTTLSAALGVVDFGLAEESSAPVLVLEAGNESVRAHLFTHGGGGPQGPRTGWCDWGGNDIDDALVDFVRDRSPSVRGTGAQDAEDVRAACASARADLATRTATEVELPGRDPVRLVRADLELLVGGTVADVIEQVVADALDPHGDRPSRVLVTGPLASLPMVVEAVSAAVGTSVEHVTDEQALQRYSSAAVLALESPAEADGVDTDEHEDDTRALPLASLRPVRRQGRHHRTAILVAASLAIAAPVAAMTMTDAGEATLLSMVDGIVPQESSEDTTSDDLLGRLTDAATLPALPWDDEDAADDSAGPIGTGGGPTGEVGTQGPAPTSTHGARKDEGNTNEKKDGKDKGSDKDDKKEKKDGKDKGKEKTKGKSSDKGSPNSSSSSGRTPNESSTSSADGPSTPDDTTSSAPDTPDPTTSTPDPTTTTPTPDPTTTTPTPDPTTTTPDPTTTTPDPTTTTSAPDPTTSAAEPDPSTTSPASTTSGATTVAAPVTSETTIAAELGTP